MYKSGICTAKSLTIQTSEVTDGRITNTLPYYLRYLPMHGTYDETEQRGSCLYSGAGCAFAYL